MTQDTQTPQQPQDETMTAIERDRFFGGVFPTRWLSGSRGKCYRWENSRVYEQATAEYVTHLEGALREAEAKAAGLYAAIAHGDDVHRAWLKEAIECHFAGRPVPSPRALQQPKAGA